MAAGMLWVERGWRDAICTGLMAIVVVTVFGPLLLRVAPAWADWADRWPKWLSGR